MLDANVVDRNAFCIMAGALLRKHAVTPKNVSLPEFRFLMATYRALFSLIDKDFPAAAELLNQANEHRNAISTEGAKLGSEIGKHATQQHCAMLRHAKAQLELSRSNNHRTVQALCSTEPGASGAPGEMHRSCFSARKEQVDGVVSKCRQLHP